MIHSVDSRNKSADHGLLAAPPGSPARRYPLYLGRVPEVVVGRHLQESFIEGSSATSCPPLGDVGSREIVRSDPVLAELRRRCAIRGLTFAEKAPRPYPLADYTFGAGSVFPHDDDGFGLTAGVLVATAPLAEHLYEWDEKEKCVLFAARSRLELKIGDAFVFNANKEHAWMANCRWVLALHHVCPMKKKK